MKNDVRNAGSAPRPSLVASPLWLLFGIYLIGANLRAPITSVGPVLDQIQSSLGLSASLAGLLNALPLVIFAGLSPFAARFSRIIGIERTLFAAMLVLVIGTLTRSLPSILALWTGTLLIACGIAVGNVLLPALVKRDFAHTAARQIGIYATTMGIAAAVATGLAVPLSLLASASWRVSINVWGIPALLALLVWLPQLRHGARADAKTDAKTVRHANVPQADPLSYRSPWRSMLGWHVSIFMALHSMVFYSLIAWFTAFAAAHRISAETAGVYLFIYQAIAIVANIGTSFIIGRLPDQRTIGFTASLLILIGVGGLLLVPGYALLWLCFAGLGAGISMVTCLTLFGLRSRHHRQAADLSGMAQSVGYGVAAIGPLAVGAIHDASGSWTMSLLFLVSMPLAQLYFSVRAGRSTTID